MELSSSYKFMVQKTLGEFTLTGGFCPEQTSHLFSAKKLAI
jgi:hypothetical protein